MDSSPLNRFMTSVYTVEPPLFSSSVNISKRKSSTLSLYDVSFICPWFRTLSVLCFVAWFSIDFEFYMCILLLIVVVIIVANETYSAAKENGRS